MFKYHLYASFVIVAIYAASVIADPTNCYHCSLRDFGRCNTPLNPDRVSKDDCNDIRIHGNHINTTARTVCYHVTATFVGIKMSERGCYYAEMDGQDLCPFFKRTEANEPLTFDYTCKTCDTDLCNSD